jgi:hypothetical protein
VDKEQTDKLMEYIAELAAWAPLPVRDLDHGNVFAEELSYEEFDTWFRTTYQFRSWGLWCDLVNERGWDYVETAIVRCIELLKRGVDLEKRREADQNYLHYSINTKRRYWGNEQETHINE